MQHELSYRGILLVLFIAAFIMSKHFRGRADKQRGKISRRGDGASFLIPQIGITLASMGWLLTYLIAPQWIAWSQVELPQWLRFGGAGLGVAAIGLFVWMFKHLGANVTATAQTRPDAQLVTTGPYRWIRHPMYVFGFIWFLAIVVLTASWFIAVTSAAGFSFLLIRCRREETNLIEKFGDEYRAYMQRTGRFFPRLGSS
ncbi:MAG: isoprenylcysteine carboxylmethyltransferase family protein [Phycisphaerales bacterium]